MKFANLLGHPRALALGAANCLLLGFLTHQLLQPVQPGLPAHQATDPVIAQLPAGFAAESDNAEGLYDALTGQPLFHQDRHLVPEVAEQAAPQTPPPAYVLTGFLGLPGRPGRAFLQPAAGGRTLVVGLGDDVEGWTVVGVGARRVELKQGERSVGIGKDGCEASTSPAAKVAGPAAETPGATTLSESTPAAADTSASEPRSNVAVPTATRRVAGSGSSVKAADKASPPPPVAVAPKSALHTFAAPHAAPHPHP